MQTKLHININQGVVDVEGDQSFVERIYEDFKRVIYSTSDKQPPISKNEANSPNEELVGVGRSSQAVKKHARGQRIQRQMKNGENPIERTKGYSPSLDSSLDTKDLSIFFAPFAPQNHSERILIFTRFLEEKLGINPCTADQIFTCYRTLKEKIPEAFAQALRDTSGNRHGYIDYRSPSEISITVRGVNHFEQGKIKLKEKIK